jgi:hypothetical protein
MGGINESKGRMRGKITGSLNERMKTERMGWRELRSTGITKGVIQLPHQQFERDECKFICR